MVQRVAMRIEIGIAGYLSALHENIIAAGPLRIDAAVFQRFDNRFGLAGNRVIR